ncbi:MAG TPA: TetR/AcrR family transcriptional regulator [Treponemataceae bacterium]|jgi:AcrR family transcriptional regulator|nr:TetR/AcrR family transcriptional regulator [Treponemataceae bacterium]
MAIVVEHEKRKREILEKSLDIFIEEGYEDVTFQKIADRCGITRTTLYIYFKNKQELFLWSIKQLTQGLETALLLVVNNQSLSSREQLHQVCTKIIDTCMDNKKLFNIILVYLLQLQKMGKDPGDRVRRRVLRLRHLLSTILIAGMKKGEFRKINVKAANEMFYGLIQSIIFRLAILDQESIEELNASFDLAIEGILNPS